MPTNFVVCATALSALIGAGCQTHKTVTPMGGGYEEVSHPQHTFTFTDDPPPPRISLQYRATDDIITQVWPSLYGVNDVIKGDLAIFVAEKALPDPEHLTGPRLFAVRSPDLPLDITDQVLWKWSKANGKDFTKTLEKFSGITPEESDGQLQLRLEFWMSPELSSVRENWPNQGLLQLAWPQVEEMIRAVKTKGVEQEDLRWHTKYIGEKF